MSGTTERVIVPVKGGVEDWKEQLKVLLQVLKEQKGYLRTRWGPHSEDQQKLELLIGWETPEDCDAWKSSQQFADTMAQFKPVMAGPPALCYVKFVPYAPKEVIDSTIVETVTFAGCSAAEDAMRAQVEKAKGLSGCNGVASGFAFGENSGQNFVAIIGWDSVEASKGADKSYAAGSTESHHVNFHFPIKGFRGL